MTDEELLFANLNAQGQKFLKKFGEFGNDCNTHEEDDPEEWTGFASESDTNHDIPEPCNSRLDKSHTPDIVVFSEGKSAYEAIPSMNIQSRAFMSPKVSKLKRSSVGMKDISANEDDNDVKIELSNTHNDALLHRLVHTQLLSGSLNPELNMTPAQRRKALAGRVLELTGDSKLGKGEGIIRQQEKKKASKRVRDGITAKQRERKTKSMDEAKNMGNYHPTLKKLFAASSSSAQLRKRDRGLKMGIGRFSGGTLKLTTEEIGSVRDIISTRGRGRLRRGGKR